MDITKNIFETVKSCYEVEDKVEYTIKGNKFYEAFVYCTYDEMDCISVGYNLFSNDQGECWDRDIVISEDYLNKCFLKKIKNCIFSLSKGIPYWNELTEYQKSALYSFTIDFGDYWFENPIYNQYFDMLKTKSYDGIPNILDLYYHDEYNYTKYGFKFENSLYRREIEMDLWRGLYG